MKNKEVVITDRNITLKENTRSVVMDAGSRELMEMYSYIVCQNGGDVLDIGFGMGYSANKMSELSNSYTCIEINPQIYQRASEWAKNKSNVNLIFGDWYDIIPQLGLKYDGIFMDTHYDFNYSLFESYCNSIAKEGCILSIYNYHTQRAKNTMNRYEYVLDTNNFTIPVESSHTINWTEFRNNNFMKTSNKIKFPKPKYTI